MKTFYVANWLLRGNITNIKSGFEWSPDDIIKND